MIRKSLLIGLLCAIAPAHGAAPAEVQLTGDWTVRITTPGPPPVTAEVEIPKPDILTITDETYESLPEFDGKIGAGWRKGAPLTGVKASECTMKGALDPGSLVLKDGPGPSATVFTKGTDYDADLEWGSVGRLPQGGIRPDQPVWISYRHAKSRIDSIVLSADGMILLRRGSPHAVTPEIPSIAAGEVRLANVYLSGRIGALSDENLFPILETVYPEPESQNPSIAERVLPKTLKKLRDGEPLRILAWGDSVTNFKRYQSMFVERLKSQFPGARIELVTEAWGGHNTGSYLAEPAGSPHSYQEKVLDRKPDLVVSEFVNDAALNEQQVEERYSRLLADFEKLGAEWIILTPHYVRPDWMGLTRQKNIDEDPRPYVKGLRLFAGKHPVALADASLRYGRLWRQGIPYLTLMENNINHPNQFGHTLFADSLMTLFPKSPDLP